MKRLLALSLLLVTYSLLIVSCPNPWVEKILEPFNREKEEEIVTPQITHPIIPPITQPNPVSSSKAITAFSFTSLATIGVINEAAKTISVTVPFGTTVISLTPTLQHTGSSYSPTGAQNFSLPVTYTVTAADGSTASYTVTVTVANTLSGSGTADDPYIINTSAELGLLVSNDLSAYYKLDDDITVSDWTAIGDFNDPFTGTFDGNGKTITINDLDFEANANNYIGLFGHTNGAEIFDLEVNLNINQTINTTGSRRVGGVSGYDDGSTFSNVVTTGDINIEINGTTRIYIGGIVSAGRNMTFEDCYSDVNITLGTNSSSLVGVGGITNMNELSGSADVNTIKNCLYAGSINVDTSRSSGYANIGGILGLTHGSPTMNIINCAVASPSIIYVNNSTSGNIRRIVGDTTSATLTISGCVAYGSMTITRNGTAVAITDNANGVDGESKTAAELLTQSTYTGWDFVNVWQMGANWPVLRMP